MTAYWRSLLVMFTSSSMSWLGLPVMAMWPRRSSVSSATVKLSG
jgi:hypothetical protein